MRNWVTDTAGILHSALRSRRDSLDYSLLGRACSAVNWAADMAEIRNSALRNRRDSLDCSSLGRAYSAANWAADMAEIRNSALRNRRDFLDYSLLGRACSAANWAAGTFESLYSALRSRCDCRDSPSLHDYSTERLALRDLLLTKTEARTCGSLDARWSLTFRRDFRRLCSVVPSASYSSSRRCYAHSTSRHIRVTAAQFRRNYAMENKNAANSTSRCE
jgi:hypothetical protein